MEYKLRGWVEKDLDKYTQPQFINGIVDISRRFPVKTSKSSVLRLLLDRLMLVLKLKQWFSSKGIGASKNLVMSWRQLSEEQLKSEEKLS